MTLAMSRPWKHPNSGVYWLRKRVPDDLRRVIGKSEEKRSLRTRNADEAKRRHAQALLELDARWANLRRGLHALTQQEIDHIAGQVYARCLVQLSQNSADENGRGLAPSDQHRGSSDFTAGLLGLPPSELISMYFNRGDSQRGEIERRCGSLADDYLQTHDLIVDPESRDRLVHTLALAIEHACQARLSHVNGHYVPNPFASPPPTWARQPSRVAPKPLKHNGVSFDELLSGWITERQPRDKTQYAWRRVIDQFCRFVGHADASRVSADDLVRWKASLLEAGLRAKTIRDGKLAPIRAILQWAVDNRRINQNPAERITIDIKGKLADRKRGYSEDEAWKVLNAAQKERDHLRRWVPWLCAFSGARVSEVCQVRAEDLVQLEGIWCVRFAPEAGSLKNVSSERAVPLHPVLIERGFLEFVEKVGSGPLFAELKPDRFGSRGGNGTKVLGRWVRAMGLTDPRISPNHSWRHRLRTLGRRYGLATDILDAITGHRRQTVADTYGEFPIGALYREMTKIPALGPY